MHLKRGILLSNISFKKLVLYLDYIYWQYVWGPRWFLQFIWNMTRAIARAFSITVMLRTLFAAWHKDTIAWHGGTLSEYALTIGWNIISRLIGFLIRSGVLLGWATTTAIFLPLAAASFLIFIFWPIIAALLIIAGFIIITTS